MITPGLAILRLPFLWAEEQPRDQLHAPVFLAPGMGLKPFSARGERADGDLTQDSRLTSTISAAATFFLSFSLVAKLRFLLFLLNRFDSSLASLLPEGVWHSHAQLHTSRPSRFMICGSNSNNVLALAAVWVRFINPVPVPGFVRYFVGKIHRDTKLPVSLPLDADDCPDSRPVVAGLQPG